MFVRTFTNICIIQLLDKLLLSHKDVLEEKKEEELKNLLMKVNEESENAGLKLNIQKAKNRASGPVNSWEIDGETGISVRLYFSGLQNHCRW